ncbi:MAG: hypothetical protein FWG05_00450 [Kiritimatiellaeota bacterium]|nr:hypothetical protein [Kiritimatiellota bacterium]
MSKQIGLDCINVKKTPRPGHTDYSLEYRAELMQQIVLEDMVRRGELAKDAGYDQLPPDVTRRFHDAWDFDFLWWTNDGYVNWAQTGRVTDMGHAVYAADGSDLWQPPNTSPFKHEEEVWAFDPLKEYGITPFDELVAKYEQSFVDGTAANPHQVCTGGYYRSIISGTIASFGWEMLLAAAADEKKFAKVLERFAAYTKHHAEAWAKTSIEAYINHDDMVWSRGAFMSPEFYRKVIFPLFADIWKPLKAAGKKVLFCTDGNAMEFWEDLAAAGADGFIFEPMNDFERMVKTFGGTHCLIGSAIDCRTMTLKGWDEVRREIDKTLELIHGVPGIITAVGNHIPPNVPEDICLKYMEYLRANW